MALALDGSVHGNTGGASSLAVSLTTTNAGDIIIVCVTANGGPVTSISDTAGLSWSKRVSDHAFAGAAQSLEIWEAVSSGTLSSDSITVNQTSSSFMTVDAFGISGASTSTKWDSNGAIPPHNGVANGFTDISFTTSNANDFIFAAYRFANTQNPTQGAGWIKISGADYQMVEYQIVSATQSSLDATIGTGSGDNSASAGDAIIQSTAVAAPTPYNPWPQAAPVLAQ